MGLISFLKNVGANIFKGGDRSEEITKLLTENLGSHITNLVVKEDDGIVTLSGEADTQATKEKAALLAGNIKGVERVDHDALTFPQPEEEPEEEVEFYTIQKGDSLSKIARTYYGNAMKYPVLFEANREVIKNPDLIYPGQVIRIPKQVDATAS